MWYGSFGRRGPETENWGTEFAPEFCSAKFPGLDTNKETRAAPLPLHRPNAPTSQLLCAHGVKDCEEHDGKPFPMWEIIKLSAARLH